MGDTTKPSFFFFWNLNLFFSVEFYIINIKILNFKYYILYSFSTNKNAT